MSYFSIALGIVLGLAEPTKHQSQDYTVLYIQILLAVVSGIVLPIIIYAINRGKAVTDRLKEQNDSAKADLRAAEIDRLKNDLSEIKSNYRKFASKFEELQRSYDRHPMDCQNKFVTADVFHRELAASKEYVKLLYGAIKQHLAKLETDLDSSDDNS